MIPQIVESSQGARNAGWSKGDRVAYYSLGSYSELTTVPHSKLVKVPENVSLEVATACIGVFVLRYVLSRNKS